MDKPLIVYLYPDHQNRANSVWDGMDAKLKRVGRVKRLNLEGTSQADLKSGAELAEIVLYEAPQNKPESKLLEALAGGEIDGNSKWVRINPFQPSEIQGICARIKDTTDRVAEKMRLDQENAKLHETQHAPVEIPITPAPAPAPQGPETDNGPNPGYVPDPIAESQGPGQTGDSGSPGSDPIENQPDGPQIQE